MKIVKINDWFETKLNYPVIISGPCSAESEQQLISTAVAINEIGRVQILRSGIWKPRTRPGSFEGAGIIALKWLKKARELTGMLTTVEVTTPEDIEASLKEEVDILWIGARSTSNPVYIRKLADALKGVDVPVLVKNPVYPDIDLWIGTIERFYNAGIRRLGAVHRGFFPFEKTSLRNIPKWEIPIELKRRVPEISLLCDPSHIAGHTDFIFDIAQKAIYLGMDGLMIETHINPPEALSDARQQLTPEQLKNLLENLHYTPQPEHGYSSLKELEMFRDQLDSIDQQLIELLAQRMEIVQKIGKLKGRENLSIFQLRRWQKVIEQNIKIGKKLGLSKDFLLKLISLIHFESIQQQDAVIRKEELRKLPDHHEKNSKRTE